MKKFIRYLNQKKMLVQVLILLFFNLFQGQNKVVDSLVLKLQSTPSAIEKADCYNELAWQYRNIDISKGFVYADSAIHISNAVSYDTGFINGLNRKGVLSINKGNYNGAILLYDSILKLETLAKNTYGIARAQHQLGNCYKKKGNLIKSQEYYEQALKNAESLQKERFVAKIANNLGSIFEMQGDVKQAMYQYTKSLGIREKLKDTVGIANCYLNIGAFHNTVDNHDLAIKNLQKSELLFQKLNDSSQISKVYNNLGISYAKLKDDESALDYYKKSLAIKNKINLTDGTPSLLNNIGIIYEKKGQLDTAIRYYKESLSLEKSENQIETNNNLGNAYGKKKQPQTALYYYEKALDSLENKQKNIVKLEILKNMALTYSQINNFELANSYNEKYIQLQDSIEAEYKDAIQIKINYEEEKSKNAILEKDKEIDQITIDRISEENKFYNILLYVIIIVAILLMTLLLVILLNYKQKQKIIIAKKNEKIKIQKLEELLKTEELKSINTMIVAQEKERKRIARDLHDRLGSMLSMVKVHFKSVEDNIEHLFKDSFEQYKIANKLLDDACDEVRKIAHDMSSGVLAKFGLIPALDELIKSLTKSNKIEIEFIDYGMDDRLENELEINVYRIIQELFSNILKHSKATEISLQILKKKKQLNLVLEDNGIGFNTEKASLGMGLMNIKSRIDNFDGQLAIDSGKGNGTTTTIHIPLL